MSGLLYCITAVGAAPGLIRQGAVWNSVRFPLQTPYLFHIRFATYESRSPTVVRAACGAHTHPRPVAQASASGFHARGPGSVHQVDCLQPGGRAPKTLPCSPRSGGLAAVAWAGWLLALQRDQLVHDSHAPLHRSGMMLIFVDFGRCCCFAACSWHYAGMRPGVGSWFAGLLVGGPGACDAVAHDLAVSLFLVGAGRRRRQLPNARSSSAPLSPTMHGNTSCVNLVQRPARLSLLNLLGRLHWYLPNCPSAH